MNCFDFTAVWMWRAQSIDQTVGLHPTHFFSFFESYYYVHLGYIGYAILTGADNCKSVSGIMQIYADSIIDLLLEA